jgi:putative aldouronate transport system substrate-binding protein
MKMKKTLCFFVILTLVGFLSACGSKTGPSGGTSRIGAKGSLPLTKERVTFNAYNAAIVEGVSSTSYADNLFTKKVADETGVLIDFISASDGTTEKLNVLLSAGDDPDLIMMFYMDQSTMDYWVDQGIFIALDQYDPMSYPNIKEALTEYPKLDSIIRSGDGKIHTLPSLNGSQHSSAQYGRLWTYVPWSMQNGQKPPQTLDEMTAFLRQIKNGDWNNNGKKDEIGIAFNKGDIHNVVSFFANSFMPFVGGRTHFGIALNNKTVVEQYKDPRFRETLKYLAGLYKEGLILEDGFDISLEQLKSLAMNADPIVGFLSAAWINSYVENLSVRMVEFLPLAPLKGPNGVQYQAWDEWDWYIRQYFVTDKCKDPELAVALYDYLIRKDVSLDCVDGIGNWAPADPGAKSMTGGTPVYKTIGSSLYVAGPQNIGWGQAAAPNIRSAEWFYGGHQVTGFDNILRWIQNADSAVKNEVVSNIDYLETVYVYTAEQFKKYAIPQDMVLPPLLMNNVDVTRIADIDAVLNGYIDTSMVEFIVGRKNISSDSEWNAYLAQLDAIGAKEKASILQKYVK